MDLISLAAIVLFIMWLVGVYSFGQALGMFVHVLLVLAIIAVLLRIIRGKPVV